MKPTTIEEYISQAPEVAREKLTEICSILKEVAPEAKELIKWGHPVFEEKRILFSISAYKNHMNFMPTGPGLTPFREELKDFKTGQDTVQFSYDKPLPTELIRRIAIQRRKDVLENDAKWMY